MHPPSQHLHRRLGSNGLLLQHRCKQQRLDVRRGPMHAIRTTAPDQADVKQGSAGHVQQQSSSRVRQFLSDPGIEGDPLKFLAVSEAYWKAMRRSGAKRVPPVVHAHQRRLREPPDFDVCMCGGTLGLMVALALQLRGHSVCIVEKRVVQGRTQEWNISWQELQVLGSLGLLTTEQLESSIATRFNPMRIAFKGGPVVEVRDCLNLGVDPRHLLQMLRERFEAAGGVIREHTAFKAADVYDEAVQVRLSTDRSSMPITQGDANRPSAVSREDLGSSSSSSVAAAAAGNGAQAEHGDRAAHQQGGHASEQGARQQQHGPGPAGNGAASAAGRPAPGQRGDLVACRLLVDCMGHYSPIVQQMRGGHKPPGMLLAVGGCAEGFPADKNETGDLLCTITDAEDDMQLYWEAFPAEGGAARTTYMFTYADADSSRPSLEALMDKYLELLPQYQGVPLEQLRFRRVLFGGFPCYDQAPLQPGFDRVLQIGDASASQSPLSFGGFGNMLRHLPRLVDGLDQALRSDKLRKGELSRLQPYQPSLSSAWLFQRSMAIKPGQLRQEQRSRTGLTTRTRGWLPPDQINRLLSCNFVVMQALGDRIMRPFVQDTIQWGPLLISMLSMLCKDPAPVVRSVFQVGAGNLLNWMRHFTCLLLYTVLHFIASPFRRFVRGYTVLRMMDAWKWGSGQDHRHAPPSSQGAGSSPTPQPA